MILNVNVKKTVPDCIDRIDLFNAGHHGGALPDGLPPLLHRLAPLDRQALRRTDRHLLLPLQHPQVL